MIKTCFVIQGFGIKTDFETGRKLDLDASYQVIKEAVITSGLNCIRADDIQSSSIIDKPLYEHILHADLVIADLSTSNVNAIYELGVRHALRPYTTIIVAESQCKVRFDLNRNSIITYKHLGDDIGRQEAIKFQNKLTIKINEIIENKQIDSPVYTYLPELKLPEINSNIKLKIDNSTVVDKPNLLNSFRDAKSKSAWIRVIEILKKMIALNLDDSYIIQQLALATYKSNENDFNNLHDALSVLNKLTPSTSHDIETLGIWGAIHKRLWLVTTNSEHLNEAIKSYHRGFMLSNDYYNGINYAYLLNVRVSITEDKNDKITDWILAERIRIDILEICKTELYKLNDENEAHKRYWILATQWEAYVGLRLKSEAKLKKDEAIEYADETWKLETSQLQINALEKLISESPL